MKLSKGFKFFCAVMALLVAATAGLGAVNYLGQKKLSEIYSSTEDVNREDNVKIADEFMIESTRDISDAYLNNDKSKLDDRQKETLDMAKAVIESETNDKMDDAGKEYAIYRYLTSKMKNDTGLLTVIPVSSADSGNPYGVLKYHTAVCVGYATTFRLLMQMMNIECMVVHSSDLTHSWNLVKLDDEWYHVDCYMDSDSGNGKSFNMNDDMFTESHTWNRDFFPAATGLKHNPAISGAEELKDIYEIPRWVSENLEEESESFSAVFPGGIKKDEEQTAKYIVDMILQCFYQNNTTDMYIEPVWAKNTEDQYVLCMFVNNGEDDIPDLPEEQKEAADKAITEYFPDFEFLDDFDYSYDYSNDYVTTYKCYG